MLSESVSKYFYLCDLNHSAKNIGVWSRVIIELVPAQPPEFEAGYFSSRIWINGVLSSQTYFPEFQVKDIDDVEINLCARRTQVLQTPGIYDLMNFIWFKGSERLYAPDPSK